MRVNQEKEWFESWFDTKWYHILYKNRDMQEAEVFLEHLIQNLNLNEKSRILDAACGSGRHSIFLNKKGFDVTGFDLSAQSISLAKKSENEKLHFQTADLRSFKSDQKFDVILNLFTSFGYFASVEDNVKVLQNFKNSLTAEGVLLIDFMNAKKVIKHLVLSEIKTVEGIDFELRRFVEDGKIIKEIEFLAEGELKHFQEKVSAFILEDFIKMLDSAGFKIKEIYGDYKFQPFLVESSPRLIIKAIPV